MKHIFLVLGLILIAKLSQSQTHQIEVKKNLNNCLKVVPLAYFKSDGYVISDYCYGLGYERLLNKTGTFAATGFLAYGNQRKVFYREIKDNFRGIKFQPGLKYYPWGQRLITVGFGVSLNYYYEQISSNTIYINEGGREVFRKHNIGIVSGTSLIFNVSNKINIGAEFGTGMNLKSRYKKTFKDIPVGYYTKKFETNWYPNYNFNFSIGYRF